MTRGRRLERSSVRSHMHAAAAAAIALALCSVALVCSAAASAAQPNENWEHAISQAGPAAWFRFNDPAGSTTLTDETGSYSAASSNVVFGNEGPFSGSSSGKFTGFSFATLPADPLLNDSAFTIEAWVNATKSTVYNEPIVELAAGSGSYLSLTPASSAAKHPATFEIVTPSGSVSVTSPKLAEERWEYVAVTETAAGKLTLYLDGSEAASVASTTLSPASLGSSVPSDYVGRPFSENGARLQGYLSNLAFYSKALSSTQLAEHYAAAYGPLNTEAPRVEGEAKEGATLETTNGSWLGLSPTKYTYRWERCTASGCETIKGASKQAYALATADVGSTVRAVVTASNAAGESSATSAASATVAGKPANVSAPAITYESGDQEEARVGELLGVRSEWRAFPVPAFGYAWEACLKGTSECVPAEGTNGEASYRVTAEQQRQGDKLRVKVTATNSYGPAEATSAPSSKVVPGQPVELTAPTIEGEALEGEPLKVAGSGTWAGSEPIEYADYEWLRCSGGHESECHPISGASGRSATSYTTTHADVGDGIAVRITAHNSAGSTAATSTSSAPIAQKPLRNTSPPTISGEAREGQQLTGSHGEWEGSEPIEYLRYTWLACRSGSCVERQSGAEDTTYTPTAADVGYTIELEVTAKNPVVAEESASSAATQTVVGNAPSERSAPLLTGTAQDEQTLTASPGEWTGTPTIGYAYQWEACRGSSCAAIPGANGSSYTIAHEYVGQTIEVQVTAANSLGHASASSAPTVAVAATAPAVADAPSVIEGIRGTSTVAADQGSWRGTPPLTYTYQWESCTSLGEENCLPISGAEGERFTPPATLSGERLRVVVTASNASGSATATSGASEVVHAAGGEAVAWGEDFYGQLGTNYRNTYEWRAVASAPGLEDIATLDAGGTENLALLAGHEVAAWGNNPHGQLGDDSFTSNREEDRSYVTVGSPEGAGPIGDVAAVAPAGEHSMALGENHRVYTWGNNEGGAIGNGRTGLNKEAAPANNKLPAAVETFDEQFSSPEEEAKEPVQIAAGGGSNYALLKDGEVMAWGYNEYGQLGVKWPSECRTVPRKGVDEKCVGYECRTGIGNEVCLPEPGQVLGVEEKPLQGVKAIYAAGEAGYALVGDGELISWGDDSHGQLGQVAPKGTNAGPGTPFSPAGYVVRRTSGGGYEHLKGVVEVSAGWNHVLARLADGEVLGWGGNESGQLGSPESPAEPELCSKGGEIQCFKVAEPLRALEPYRGDVEQLSAGAGYSTALVGHEVYAFGANGSGQLGLGTIELHESCSTPHLEKVERERWEAASRERQKEREENGEPAKEEKFTPKGRYCSRTPHPVLVDGTFEKGDERPLTGVASISAGGTNNHTEALLEPGVQQPAPVLSVAVTSKENPETKRSEPVIKTEWRFPEPEKASRVLWVPTTLGQDAEPEKEEAELPPACAQQEAEGKPVECPVDETEPRAYLDYEEFQKEQEKAGETAKNEGAATPRVKANGEGGEKITINNTGRWAGNTPMTYHYQWQRCVVEAGAEESEEEGTPTGECEAVPQEGSVPVEGTITGEVSRKIHTYDYTITKADLGYRIRLAITAENSAGENFAYSPATQPVRLVGEARKAKLGQEDLKKWPTSSYEISSWEGKPLEAGKVYQVKVGAGEFNEEGKQTHYMPRVLTVPIPEE